MLRLFRDNAWTRIEGLTPALRERLHWHLAVHLQTDQPTKGVRFGRIWMYNQKWFGSMLHDAHDGMPDRVPAGLTRHVAWIAQQQGVAVDVFDERKRPPEAYPWHSMRPMKWRHYQDQAHDAVMQYGSGVIVAPPRCLAGDTWIGVHRNGKSYRLRLRDLVERVLGPCPQKQVALARVCAGETMVAVARDTGYSVRQLRHWKDSGEIRVSRHQNDAPTLIRYRDAEGYVRLAPLLGAVRAGVKPLFRVTLASGKAVRASLDHKFWTSDGWFELRDLREGSLVWEQAPRLRVAAGKRSNYPYAIGLTAHPYAHSKKRKHDGFRVGWHRLVMEAQLSRLSLSAFVDRVRSEDVAGLVFVNPREQHVHHQDHDKQNYELSNLVLLDRREHLAKHGREETWRNVAYKTRLSPVVSIDPAGEGDTYDLCMPDPHNFLANGIVVSNSGKTAMAARAVDAISRPALYIAPSVPIVRQTYETFCKLFGEHLVARLDGEATDEQRKINKPIVVSTAASAIRQSAAWWKTREVLVLDEVHHAASNSWHEINQLASHIYYRLGFTGTYFRTGGDDLAMHAVTGDVIFQVTVEALVAQKYLAQPKVFFLNYKAPRVGDGPWHQLYERGIVQMEARNKLVVSTANFLMEQGDRIIVLTRRRAHADLLGKMLQNSVVVKGGEGALTSGAVRDFLRGRHQVLVGTTVIGEGVDVPAASALIYASGGSDGVQLIQSYFRPMTLHTGKSIGRIYDFVDKQHRLLDKHSKDREDAARVHLGNGNVFTH